MDCLENTITRIETEQSKEKELNKKESSKLKALIDKYQSYVQTHRKTAFLKNMVISGAAFMAGGYYGAKAISQITVSKTLITTGSLLSQYAVGFAVFLPLHAVDNYDAYHEEGKRFKYPELAKDTGKLILGLGILDAAYIIVRPLLHYNFMKKGIAPETASLYADFICTPAYWALSVPVAKLLGVIKKNKQGIPS